MAARMAMIAITTSNSIKVKPRVGLEAFDKFLPKPFRSGMLAVGVIILVYRDAGNWASSFLPTAPSPIRWGEGSGEGFVNLNLSAVPKMSKRSDLLRGGRLRSVANLIGLTGKPLKWYTSRKGN
jgi:hypothetical protein